MFVTRASPAPQLPSFSELMLSIVHQSPLPQPMANDLTFLPAEVVKQHQLVYTARPTMTLQPQAMRYTPQLTSIEPAASPLGQKERMLPPLAYDLPTPPASVELSQHNRCDSKSPVGEASSSPMYGVPKRKHACKTCGRLFTTLGHLARHNRTHTGERKHMCPWPQCEARFARQDNCMQHYKTHMNGKGKRNRLRR
ncbi:CIC11C00000000592 [Sungouiella intermedia]|uniref:CIC11C00000000592 n=1 Tax=Sungouiella intermedia TaxID=45354 RepID=A0A1L0BVK6_9ASCO|nr:CIC11C00000000592 [[Candida] intermedia]